MPLHVFSPTQHEKLDTCDRAWAFRYIAKLKTEPKPSAAKGTAAHDVLKRYFNKHELPASDEIGQIVLPGLKFLPLPHPSLIIEGAEDASRPEEEIGFRVLLGDVWEQGKIDVYDPSRTCGFLVGEHSEETPPRPWPAFDHRGQPIPLIIDHKTTSDLSKWVKTDAILRGVNGLKPDPQPAVYGAKACVDFLGAHGTLPSWVHFRWVYYSTKKGDYRAKAVDVRMTPDEIANNCAIWLADADRAFRYLDHNLSPEQVAPRLSGCGKFGGCDYGPPTRANPKALGVCKLTDGERLKAAMTQHASLAEQAKALFALVPDQQNQNNGAGNMSGIFGQSSITNVPQNGGAQAQAPVFGGAQAQAPVFGGAQAQAPVFGGALNPPEAQAAFARAAQTPPAAQLNTPQWGVDPNFSPGAVAVVDARLNDPMPPTITPEQRTAWLAHCDLNKLDHKTGAPTAAKTAPQSAPASDDATFKLIAERMIAEGREPVPGAHPRVVEIYSALRAMVGGQGAQAAPMFATAPQAPTEEPKQRRRGRPKKDATALPQGVTLAGTPQIVITVDAVRELIDFLESLIPE